MELNQLRYFQVVAKHQNMTRAARELHVSQSSLSKTIATLERDIGTQLFDRIGGHIVLNTVGQQFLARIQRGLMEIDDAVRELKATESGEVSFSTANPGVCGLYMYRFIRAHPGVILHQYPMPVKRSLEALEAGDIDFCLSYAPLPSNKTTWQPVMDDPMVILVSRSHPLAGQPQISLRQLERERFVLNNSDFGVLESGKVFCQRAGFEPRVLFEGSDLKLSLELISDNVGVMFMSKAEYLWNVERKEEFDLFQGVTALHISEPDCTRTVGVALLCNHYLSSAAQLFVDGM